MKKILTIFLLLIVMGCKKKESIKLNINCNDDKFVVNDKKTFTCELTHTNYNFNIDTKDNTMTIIVDKPGLSEQINGGISLRGEYQVFNLKKGKKLKLVTQTTDYNENIIIEWK